ncbi:MAG: glycosyltransferase family 2 protein [Planctomycetaceae bacterium]
MSHSPVSVIILTYNEETTIEECLSFLDWADDVILVDSFSTDRTVEVALAAIGLASVSALVRGFRPQRNYALDETSPAYEWVLFLDADEHCNSDCQRGIQEAVKIEGIRRLLSDVSEHVSWSMDQTLHTLPVLAVAVAQAREVRYRKEGHGQREVTDGPLGYIEEPYDHYGFINGLEHWIARHNKYSTNEVELIQHLRTQPLAAGRSHAKGSDPQTPVPQASGSTIRVSAAHKICLSVLSPFWLSGRLGRLPILSVTGST